jgi:hypothetical protein
MKRLLAVCVLCLCAVATFAQWSTPAQDIPAYNAAPPAKGAKLDPILSGQQLTGPNFTLPWQVKAYHDAARIQSVLYQLPCYCDCDQALGHTSLRSCFEGLHGAECSTCSKEAIYAYNMTMQGKSVAQIRAGIEHGDFQQIDLEQAGRGL